VQVRGNRCDLNDLPSLDPELYGNLLKLTTMPAAVEQLTLSFTIASEAYGVSREVPLMPGARGSL
jgi:HECT-domain (ubiquitin-transferase)